MKPVYLSPAQWEDVRLCITAASQLLLAQSYEAGDNKEKRNFLFEMSEEKKRLCADIAHQIAD